MQKNKTLLNKFPRRRIELGLIIAVGGFLILMVGLRPDLFQLDRSPVLGFIQIAVMLAGLAAICVGGYICLSGLWKGCSPSIAAELGLRIISTGYIIAVFAGLADIFGLGSHPYPEFIPYFGEWQARGVQIAEGFIAIGMLLMLPYSRHPFFNSRQVP
ncbi:MAG: hypothetical protein MUO42_00900, partial [Anaerolineaceae bacterium]|nr:hypothetical protein [Anaerolineaceae bacterium]